MKKILLAGGAGFIGSHLCDRILTRKDVELCFVVDNLWTGLQENLEHIKDGRLRFARSDVETFATDLKFDEVYHLASPATPLWYMAEPRRTISANVGGALRLLDLLNSEGRFCYLSTSEVYGDPLMSPQPESYKGSVDCTGPRASYDEGKRCTEALLFETQRTTGLDVRVVRLFNVYGPRTRADDGRAVSNFIAQALSNRPMTIYGDGSQTRSWGYIDDMLEGLSRFFWKDEIDYRGPINMGNDREISVIDIAKYIAALIPGSTIEHLPPAPQDPTNRRPDLTIAKRLLPGWEPKVPFEQGIAHTLEWFQERMAAGYPMAS